LIIARTGHSLKRAFTALRKEGLLPSLAILQQDVFQFFRNYLFHLSNYYLYEHTIKERDETDFLPKIQSFDFYIVSSNQEADELAGGGVDFRDHFPTARQTLERGGVAFCIFIGGEFAHGGWVALTEHAKKTFDRVPYPVDFSNNEACTGGTLTLPKFRGKGLMKYCYFKRFEFLREKGIKISRNAVKADNVVSQRVHAKFGPKRRGIRYLRLLKWKFLIRVEDEVHN
jgi:GNAT superfamily N-acetyltransferase